MCVAAIIAEKWRKSDVAGTLQEIRDVTNVLCGKGRLIIIILLFLLVLALLMTNHAVIYAGEWTKNIISNRDIIRLQLACEALDLAARESIFNTAFNTFGEEGVNTDK